MAGLMVKASSLVELVVATVIICIASSSISIVYLHFFRRSESTKETIIQIDLAKIEDEILIDPHYPNSSEKYQRAEIRIINSKLFNSDSLLKVHLIYSDSASFKSLNRIFIYAKD